MRYIREVLAAPLDGCTTWPFSPGAGGRGAVAYFGKRYVPAALVCEWYHGPRPPGLECRHLCGNGHLACFNPAHLCWGTHVENMADRHAHGTTARAQRNAATKLTEAQRAEIRQRYQRPPRAHGSHGPGPSQAQLAAEYGVTQRVISLTIRGLTH